MLKKKKNRKFVVTGSKRVAGRSWLPCVVSGKGRSDDFFSLFKQTVKLAVFAPYGRK